MDSKLDKVSGKRKRSFQSSDDNEAVNGKIYLTSSSISDSTLENTLPQEIILKILKNLSIKDLCNVIIVSKYFWMIGTDPSLWSRAVINRAKLLRSDMEDIKKFFTTGIRIPRLDLSGCHTHRFPIEKIIGILQSSFISNISEVNLSGVDLEGVAPDLLGRVVGRSTKVVLNDCKGLKPLTLLKLFTHSSKSTTLKHMELEKMDLLSVPVELITKTIRRLKMVSLKCCGSLPRNCRSSPRLSDSDITTILLAIKESSTLEHVHLIGPVLTKQQAKFIKDSFINKVCLTACSCLSEYYEWELAQARRDLESARLGEERARENLEKLELELESARMERKSARLERRRARLDRKSVQLEIKREKLKIE